jgi:hypothetical protein
MNNENHSDTIMDITDQVQVPPPPPKPPIADGFPALQEGYEAESITEIKSQWLRYNNNYLQQKDVCAMSSDSKLGLWKSICACVKVKTIREWKNNTICKAHIFISRNKVKSVGLVHTCTDQHIGRKRNYKFAQMESTSEELRKLPKNNKCARREAARQYMDAAQSAGFALNESQAYKAVFRMSQQPIDVQMGQYFLLPSIFQAWKRADPDGTYFLDTINPTWKPEADQFQRYYIAPSFCKHAWKHSKTKLFISDASNTATNWMSFNMSMMLAITLDGNNDVVVLAIALCDDDSELSWIWFLQNLMRDYNNIQVFLSNSDCVMEGTNIPNLLQLMNAVPSRCVTSLVNNLERLHSMEFADNEKTLIHQIAKATTPQEYDGHLRELARINPDAAMWLDEHKKQFAAFSFLQQNRSRFGAVASNANELLNSTIQEVKDQPVAAMTTSLLMNISAIHYDRNQKAQQWLADDQQISDYAKQIYEKILQDAETCQVQVVDHEGDLWKAIVSQPRGEATPVPNVVVTVNTASFQRECSCQWVEEMGMPCVHCAAMLCQQNLQPQDHRWFHARYHSHTLIQMYDSEPPDLSLFGKLSSKELVPPEHKLVGPPKRRKIPAVAPDNPHKCAACGERGHHPKTCLHPSTQYRYEQFSEKARQCAESACDIKAAGLFKK